MNAEALTILHRGIMDTLNETMRQIGGTPGDMMTIMEAMAAETIVNLSQVGSEDQVTQAFGENVRDLVNDALQKKSTAH